MMHRGHAVVAGGSMAGLLAAEVLAGSFARVTIVEADTPPEGPVHRRGVPQSEHAHQLTARGAGVLEELMPGLTTELAAAGAMVGQLDLGPERGLRITGAAGPLAATPTGAVFVGASRPLLESRVRARVLARPNTTLVPRTRVSELVAAGSGIGGVVVRGADGSAERRTIEADLVVDATGRRSAAPSWLAALGYPPIPETTIETRLGYATRWMRRPAARSGGWEGTIVTARPGENPRVGVLLPVEDGMCTVTLGGVAGHYPPTDEEGFLAWARDLPDRALHDAIAESEPLTEIRGYRTPTSRLRHVERAEAWPDGFVMTGDAVCAFNPTFGQGMSVAALEAVAIREALAAGDTGVERDVRRRIARVVAAPWELSSSQDLRWDVPVHGGPDRSGRWASRVDTLRARYTDAVLATATADPAVSLAFGRVAAMVDPPEALARPGVALRVLRHRLRGRPASAQVREQPASASRMRPRAPM